MTPDSEKSLASAVILAHLASGEFNMEPDNWLAKAKDTLRLLIPITATEDSRWGVNHALRLHEQGRRIEVVLLNIGEIITDWQVLRFRSQVEMAAFQAERAQDFINEASAPLLASNIPVRGHFRRGDPVFCILDAAEEFDCDQIVMPVAPIGLCVLFSNNIVTKVVQNSRVVPVVTVDREGLTAGKDRN